MSNAVTVFDGMIEHPADPLTISSLTVQIDKIESLVGGWFVAVTVRYGTVTFQRHERGGAIAYAASVGNAVVATLTIIPPEPGAFHHVAV